MRISPREAGDSSGMPEGLRYVGQWPEQVRISDAFGGLIRDFRLILLQNLGLFAIVGVVAMYTLFVLWALPPDVWFYILSACYGLGALLIPYGMMRYVSQFVTTQDDDGEYTGSGIALNVGGTALVVLALILAVKLYESAIWDWLDTWTDSFFFFKVPGITAWAMAGIIMAFLTAIFAMIGAQKLTMGALFGTLGLIGYWLLTAEWGLPTLHLYIILFAIDGALIFASYAGAQRLFREIRYPFWGSLQVEEGEPVEEEEYEPRRFRQYIGISRNARAGLLPPGDMIEIIGPKGEEWIICTTNLVSFIEDLPIRGIAQSNWKGVKMPAGLVLLDSNNGDVVIKDEPITQWPHWAPYRKFLMDQHIYDGKDFYPEFRDRNGGPDPSKILEELRL